MLIDVLGDVWRSYSAGRTDRALEATQDAVRHARIAGKHQPSASWTCAVPRLTGMLLRSLDRRAEAETAAEDARRLSGQSVASW